MVSGRWKTLRQSFEQPLAVMKNFTRLSMHQRRRADDPASEYFADRLVTETNSQHRNGFMKMPDDIFRNSRIRRRTRTGRNDDTRRLQAVNFLKRDLIVSEYAKLFPKLAQILNEV